MNSAFAPTQFSPNSLGWFARHEARLIWRDIASMLTGGKPKRIAFAGLFILALIVGMHWFAAHMIAPFVVDGIQSDKSTLLVIYGALVMFFSLMFSQAIESVTRAYYARSDLDLILSSPAHSHRLFSVRTGLITLQTIALSTLIAAPLINVLIFMDGARWLSAYLVLATMGGVATALAVGVTLILFKVVGAARTRLIAQIIAAIVGAGFIILLQAFAILFGQSLSRFSFFTSSETIASAPELDSWFWVPAQAVAGDPASLLGFVIVGLGVLFATIYFSARRFGEDVLATSGLVEKKSSGRIFGGFKNRRSLRSVLRSKEWSLLKRDPWLISQTLQQILYLVPPGLLLWVSYGQGDGIYYVIVPVVVMATGQLAGGLSWITISGEDAHELIDTAPLSGATILRAKVEAVLAVIACVLLPFAAVMLLFSPRATFFLILGVAMASACAVTIQLWFRGQMNRSLFRRRQVSSKAATLCEAFVSILWAAAAGLGIVHAALMIPAIILIAIVMAVAWYMKPERQTA